MSQLEHHVLRAKAFVFDLDGTLIDTTPLVERHWREFALEHDLDPEKVIMTTFDRLGNGKMVYIDASNTLDSCHFTWTPYHRDDRRMGTSQGDH